MYGSTSALNDTSSSSGRIRCQCSHSFFVSRSVAIGLIFSHSKNRQLTTVERNCGERSSEETVTDLYECLGWRLLTRCRRRSGSAVRRWDSHAGGEPGSGRPPTRGAPVPPLIVHCRNASF